MNQKKIFKKLIQPWLVPVTKSYLRKERIAHFMGLTLCIPPGVFHPSLFFSSRTICRYLKTQSISGKKIIEIGCGSGVISIFAAKEKANVLACDINALAVSTTIANSQLNNVSIQTVQSNLFEKIIENQFELIINNPPYYPKDPITMEDHAWYAGKDFNYFQRLFRDSKKHLAVKGKLMLVLSDDCNIPLINKMAEIENFQPQLVYTRNTWLEKNFIWEYALKVN
jgi:release factor glutamine methyltransferase